jgi:hypothetical protein
MSPIQLIETVEDNFLTSEAYKIEICNCMLLLCTSSRVEDPGHRNEHIALFFFFNTAQGAIKV